MDLLPRNKLVSFDSSKENQKINDEIELKIGKYAMSHLFAKLPNVEILEITMILNSYIPKIESHDWETLRLYLQKHN